VSVNGFQAWLRGGNPDRKRLTDAQLKALMRSIHAEVKGADTARSLIGTACPGSAGVDPFPWTV
jgi:hypothetical protein